MPGPDRRLSHLDAERAEQMAAISTPEARQSSAERRRRQLALVQAAADRGQAQSAQDLADSFDAFERLPMK